MWGSRYFIMNFIVYDFGFSIKNIIVLVAHSTRKYKNEFWNNEIFQYTTPAL